MPAKKASLPVADMSVQDQRADAAQRQRKYRAAKKAAIEEGAAMPNETILRDLLADLAIMMIYAGADGEDTLMAGIRKYYETKPGWPIAIKTRIRSRKIKPKILK